MTRIWQHSNKMMSKFLFFILYSLFFITLTGCSTHSSDNGNLDNWWYLRQVDDLTENTTTDYVSKKVFWGYIGALMQTQGAGAGTYLYRFDHSGNTLRVHTPRHHSRGKGDPLLTEDELSKLEVQGLHLRDKGNVNDGEIIYEETFTVEELNSDRMVLLNEDKTLRLHFIAW